MGKRIDWQNYWHTLISQTCPLLMTVGWWILYLERLWHRQSMVSSDNMEHPGRSSLKRQSGDRLYGELLGSRQAPAMCDILYVYCAVCTVPCVLWHVYCTVCTLPCVLCRVYFAVCTFPCVLCRVYCAVCTVTCVPCRLHCAVCIAMYRVHLQICGGGGITIALLARISSLLKGERARRLKEQRKVEKVGKDIVLTFI